MTGGSDILDRLRAAPGRLSRPKSAGWLQLSPPFAGTGAMALTGPVLLVLTVLQVQMVLVLMLLL